MALVVMSMSWCPPFATSPSSTQTMRSKLITAVWNPG
jgi:hypothetical protein